MSQKQSFKNCEFLYSLAGGSWLYKGQELSSRDLMVATDALRIWLLIVHDITCVGHDASADEGRWRVLCKEVFRTRDLFVLLDCLETLTTGLIETVANVRLRDWRAYKGLIDQGCSAREPITLLLGLMRKHVRAWFEQGSYQGFKSAYQCVVWVGRLNLEFADLLDNAWIKWCESEKICAIPRDYTGGEKQILEEWFPRDVEDELFKEFYPSHGPGSTLEHIRDLQAKYMTCGFTDEGVKAFCASIGFDPQNPDLMQRMQIEDVFETEDEHRIHFVAKNWKVYRGVSCETVERMFFQRGAQTALYRWIRRRKTGLSRHYCVDSDDINRELAWQGSIDGSYATIDLSAASDSVSKDLVFEWFNDTCLYTALRALRSTYARVRDFWFGTRDFSVYEVAKYAPMGSALCFPIESAVFAAVVENIVRCTPGVNRRFAVYGDDIVCDSRIANKVCERLKQLGFQPNMRKTFLNRGEESPNFFRESCGGEYLDGYDVTPARISRKFNGFLMKPVASYHLLSEKESSSVAQLIQLANDLEKFPSARHLVIQELLATGLPILFDETGLRGVRTSNPTNFHLKKRRWNPDYQYWECQVVSLYRKRQSGYYTPECASGLPDRIRLFADLSLAEKSARSRLLYPEDAVDVRDEPYSTELAVRLDWLEMPVQPAHSLE